jgi:hypothetical protein
VKTRRRGTAVRTGELVSKFSLSSEARLAGTDAREGAEEGGAMLRNLPKLRPNERCKVNAQRKGAQYGKQRDVL